MSGTVRYRLAGLLFAGVLIAAWAALGGPSARAAEGWQPAELDGSVPRVRLAPLFDAPVRDTSICKGADGRWYMTGTYDAGGTGDFQNNDGIHLWRSSDLKGWQSVGQVWSIERDAAAPQSAWQTERRVNPDDPYGPLVRGMVSPEIHCFRNTYWIAYSMNGHRPRMSRWLTLAPGHRPTAYTLPAAHPACGFR